MLLVGMKEAIRLHDEREREENILERNLKMWAIMSISPFFVCSHSSEVDMRKCSNI